jgi:ATP-dependent RNA/DNA helicase IGHMBP2
VPATPPAPKTSTAPRARDAAYFEALGYLLDLERDEERDRLSDQRATQPLAELEARGLVWLELELQESSVGLGGRALLTFARFDARPLATRATPGDLVSLSPRRAPIDDPPRGTVSASTRSRLTVAFDRPPPEWVSEGRLRVDLLSNDVTWERGKAGLSQWGASSSGQARDRREVLLGNQPARFDSPARFEPSRPLNPEQLEAVTLALGARDFALVHGPPGTGKSTVLAEIATQAVARGQRLLGTAASNAAVDHLLELCLDAGLRAVRVGHPARVLPRLQAHTLDLTVEAHPDRRVARGLFEEAFELLGYARKQRDTGRSGARYANAREASAEARRLMGEARALERRALRSVLDGADVVCATLSVLEGGLLGTERFDLALLDEATQATEPMALLAFLRAPVVVLAGDPQQLPPTVLSREAQAQGLGVSLFERLASEHGDPARRLLKEQHRMHERLMAFPSQEFYDGALRAHVTVAARTLVEVLSPDAAVDAPPLLFLDTAGKGYEEVVAARARALIASGLNPSELAVITPYRAQALLLRESLSDLSEVEVDSIDAFQGREKDAVLLSLVRSNAEQSLGFLQDLRRMNVALTRARRHLFVVGDSATLSSHAFYARLVEHVQSTGGYRSAWEWTEVVAPGLARRTLAP